MQSSKRIYTQLLTVPLKQNSLTIIENNIILNR
jgi:hypothetical protein